MRYYKKLLTIFQSKLLNIFITLTMNILMVKMKVSNEVCRSGIIPNRNLARLPIDDNIESQRNEITIEGELYSLQIYDTFSLILFQMLHLADMKTSVVNCQS